MMKVVDIMNSIIRNLFDIILNATYVLAVLPNVLLGYVIYRIIKEQIYAYKLYKHDNKIVNNVINPTFKRNDNNHIIHGVIKATDRQAEWRRKPAA